MLIKQIALKNFRQYKDLQVVEFSCDKEKNVTVILGDNNLTLLPFYIYNKSF